MQPGMTLALSKSITRHKVLSREEEIELGQRSLAGDIRARQKLVLHNMRLAVRQSSKYQDDEATQAAMLGLTKAARKFDPTKSTFATYAQMWILSEIQVWAHRRRMIHIPEAQIRAKNPADIPDGIRSRPVSLNDRNGMDRELGECIAAEASETIEFTTKEFERWMLLAGLSPTEKQVMRTRFNLETCTVLSWVKMAALMPDYTQSSLNRIGCNARKKLRNYAQANPDQIPIDLAI